ncbi:MAG TPA: class I tRNA ligase family protein [Acidimicrobiales bacterium]|nr:class I tRNA ligase family protein [Acidimicrobiales bacterium]
MADPRCIVTAPLPVTRGLGFGELATVVAGDALVRRAWAVGRAAELVVPTLTGDLSSHYAFDKELAREGQDRTSVKPDELAARAAAFEEERRVVAAEQFARLSVTADLGMVTTDTAAVTAAAQTAFVRLHEEGLVEEADRVVATCPRCRTAVDAADAERGELDGEVLTLRLRTSSGADLDVVVREPELLPGAVAVGVPEGSPVTGATVIVPIADREVPILVYALRPAASVVVPGHDGDDHALALAHGLRSVPVLDADGAVVGEGPLHGLGRYAARAAAKALLEAEGVLLAADPAVDDVWRCRCCGSVLVSQLGRHWFLRAAAIEIAAADAVRNGLVAFSPPEARDAFLAGAGARRDWCISSRVPGGTPLPAATCLECGKLAVDLTPSSSCGKCMGTMVAEPLALDARFIAAVWPLVLGGWPGRRPTGYPPEETVAVVSAADLVGWVLPAVALALRLVGVAPFGGAVVHPWPQVDPAPDDRPFVEDTGWDARVLRLALVAGTPELDVAAAAVDALDRPYAEDIDPAEAAEAAAAGVAALDECSPAQAAALLASALSAGVPADAADRLRALALPILGD